jgi:uncharacterized protein
MIFFDGYIGAPPTLTVFSDMVSAASGAVPATMASAAAAASKLDDPDQRARPCMLTRFAYDLEPGHAALAAAAEAERNIAILLAALFPPPIPDFRLRLVGRLDKPGGALPYATELHMSAQPDGAGARRLEEAVAAQGFSLPRIVILETVSGHYDRLEEK